MIFGNIGDWLWRHLLVLQKLKGNVVFQGSASVFLFWLNLKRFIFADGRFNNY